ncbi:MAG: hypothetical protein P1P88_22245 [Bacteroidales bacterium]|nr:hypothetical protein [Bacteroidales bacterium]
MKKKIAAFGLIFLTIIGIFIYYLGFYAERPDIYSEQTEQKISATELFNKFEQDENQANATYIDKIIEVSGTIAEIQKNQDNNLIIILRENDEMFGVICTMKEHKLDTNNTNTRDKISIKGICKGYLSDVILNDCIIIKE